MARLIDPVSDSAAANLPDEQKAPPIRITGKCQQCGKCCEFYKCALVDAETGQCTIYKNRPVACRTWPNRKGDIDSVGCPSFTQTGL